MAKHTPGPWTTKLYSSQIVVRGPKDIQVLATSWHGSIRASYPLKNESIANAMLASAAPEMFEALGALVADVLEYERINNLAPNPGKPDCWQSITRAKAALAKATGEQSPVEPFPSQAWHG